MLSSCASTTNTDLLVKIITDNEWQGKYEALEKQLLDDHIQFMISLGDNLPTGSKKQVGGKSYFKTQLKRLVQQDPAIKQMSLYEQLKLVYKLDPETFLANYRECPEHAKRGAEFVRNSQLPGMRTITGNREFDFQEVFDFIAHVTRTQRVDYMDTLRSAGKFGVLDTPFIEYILNSTYKSTTTIAVYIPYSPYPEQFNDIERYKDRINKSEERIILLTHENPCPERFGSDRKAVMQKVIDAYITTAREKSPNVILFCGHLDISAEPFEYLGIVVQPISGTESIILDTGTGEYTKQEIKG